VANKATAKTKKVPGFRITAKRDGFRRAGREWHGVTEVPATEFDKKQIEQLKDEDGKKLVVVECEIEVVDVDSAGTDK